MANRTKKTPSRIETFLKQLAVAGNVSESASAAGVARSIVYVWRDDDPDFAAAWDAAEQEAMDRLEREAFRRACEGYEEPVFYQGAQVAVVRKYSDRMLEFLLKGGRPEKFKDRVENTMLGKDGQPLNPIINVTIGDGAKES